MGSANDGKERFETVLRRGLGRRNQSPAADPCPEPEVMAAWAEGALRVDESARLEQHLSNCSRCMATVAALERTRRLDVAGSSPQYGSLFRWLVPLTAAATVIAVWIAMPREQSRPSVTSEVQAERPASPPQLAPPPEPEQNREQQNRDHSVASPPRGSATAADAVGGRERSQSLDRQDLRAEADRANELGASTAPQAMRQAVASVVVSSPDAAVLWRATPQGVERSIDTGKTWTSVWSGTGSTIIAGSSPARDVCWLIGRSGLVLLSTDGVDFQTVSLRQGGDLMSIRSLDARRATVTTADGRTFSTSDGGAVWAAVPSP